MSAKSIPSAALLRQDLAWIRQHFDIDELLNHRITPGDIQQYYSQSNIAYRLVHSLGGAVHMALSQGGRFRFSDYDGHARYLIQHIQSFGQEVLELGCGTGYNLEKLAVSQPGNRFYGVDITHLHVIQAKNRLRNHNNAIVNQGDFHKLSYGNGKFDTVYDVEAVCHAQNIEQVVGEVYRVLKPSGFFILFDGFRVVPSGQLSEDEYLARRLIEKSMALENVVLVDDLITKAEEADFLVKERIDIADQIMPNLLRLRQLIMPWRLLPFGFSIAHQILPANLVNNAIAALLMPYMVGNGYQGYFRILLQKR